MSRPFFKKWRRPPFRKYVESNFDEGDDGRFYAKADLTDAFAMKTFS
jgi:hypothetical protein